MEFKNPRLLAILNQIGECDCLCDIGTDHAFLPILAVQNKIAKRAIASDVKFGPLKIAEKNIVESGLQDRISVVKSDGFREFQPGEFDIAVIAGMGGHLISDILGASPDVARSCRKLILQPMMDIPFCREWLFQNKFDIIDEVLAIDEHKVYVIITAVPVVVQINCLPEDIIIGPVLKLGRDSNFSLYVDKLIRRRKQRLAGLCVSGTKESFLASEIVKNELELLHKFREKG